MDTSSNEYSVPLYYTYCFVGTSQAIRYPADGGRSLFFSPPVSGDLFLDLRDMVTQQSARQGITDG